MSHVIHAILEELRSNNGSKHKMQVLKDNKDNMLLQRLLKMTYDRVDHTYGITMKSIALPYDRFGEGDLSLDMLLAHLHEHFDLREIRGNAGVTKLQTLLLGAESHATAIIITQVINRDLRINMGRSNINKVFPGLITKPAYMRCDAYNEKTAEKFNVDGAYLQLKADGTYREFYVHPDHGVKCVSRQGEAYDYPEINELLMQTDLGGPYYFIGELTVYRDGVLLPRAEGNGILRKDVFPDGCEVRFDCWDIIPEVIYILAVNRKTTSMKYKNRWSIVTHYLEPLKSKIVKPIECTIVKSMSEALQITAYYMAKGFEGAILKDPEGLFKDGTSRQQIKLKVKIELEVRVTGFNEGTAGTKREDTFGSMTFSTDDEQIKGSVSGFSDAQLAYFNSRREGMLGQVMTVECNDITQARGSHIWALSHPRFIELRTDKDSTDTFESAQAAKSSAMMIDSQL